MQMLGNNKVGNNDRCSLEKQSPCSICDSNNNPINLDLDIHSTSAISINNKES